MSVVLVTGSAGFIGSHVVRRILAGGHEVVGVDDLGGRIFPSLKAERERRLAALPGFTAVRADVADLEAMDRVFRERRPDRVVHLAARTGVRDSVTHPFEYVQANVVGFVTVLELAKRHGIGRVVYASSSSIYGDRSDGPYRETDRVDAPVSLYAATKGADELVAHAYARQPGPVLVGLRLFTVYGPWGRPDMALWTFAERIAAGQPIRMFNGGRMRRDFTSVHDVVDAIIALLSVDGLQRFEVFNVGAGQPQNLDDVVRLLEQALGRDAVREFLPMQPGDVQETWADTTKLAERAGVRPAVPIEVGVPAFARWYLAHPGIADAVRRERGMG